MINRQLLSSIESSGTTLYVKSSTVCINIVKNYKTLRTIKPYKTMARGGWKCTAALRLLRIKVLTYANTKTNRND